MKNFQKKQKLIYIIDDGTYNPLISNEIEFKQNLKSLFKIYADLAENYLLSDNRNEPSIWRRILNNLINNKYPDYNDKWWIKSYVINDQVIDHWNAYMIRYGFNRDIIDIENISSIRHSLLSNKHIGLIQFIDKFFGYDKSFYIPEEILLYKRIKRLL